MATPRSSCRERSYGRQGTSPMDQTSQEPEETNQTVRISSSLAFLKNTVLLVFYSPLIESAETNPADPFHMSTRYHCLPGSAPSALTEYISCEPSATLLPAPTPIAA